MGLPPWGPKSPFGPKKAFSRIVNPDTEFDALLVGFGPRRSDTKKSKVAASNFDVFNDTSNKRESAFADHGQSESARQINRRERGITGRAIR